MPQSEDSINLRQIIAVSIANWKWILLSVFLCLCAAAFYILRSAPVFSRTMEVIIKDERRGASMAADLGSFANFGLVSNRSNVNNELIAMQSPASMIEVVKRMNLNVSYYAPGIFHDKLLYGNKLPINITFEDASDYEGFKFRVRFMPDGTFELFAFEHPKLEIDENEVVAGVFAKSLDTPLGKMKVVINTAYKAPSEEDAIQEIIVYRSSIYATATAWGRKLQTSLKNKEATVISMEINDVSTQRAEDFLNTVLAVYNENWVRDNNKIAVSSSVFIEERLKMIERDLSNVDANISEFKSKNMLPNVEASTNLNMSRSAKASEKILELNTQLYMTRYIRTYLADRANEFQILPANSGISNSNIESQIAEYNRILLNRNNLLANSSLSNPLVEDMDNSLTNMRGAIISSVENQIITLEAQINSLQNDEQRINERIAASPDQAKYLLSVERQQAVKEALYLFLLQKREENELTQTFTAYNTRVITPPTGSLRPVSPNKRNIILIAFLLGLCIPVAFFFLRETLNTKLRNKKDLESLSLPLLGEIPISVDNSKRLFKKPGALGNVISVKMGDRSIINEAFRVLRTNLEFMLAKEEGTKVIVLTSFNPGSGKSYISMNLAVSLAIKKRKVLVIDGDLRHASASQYVESPHKGLVDYLASKTDDIDSLIINDVFQRGMSVLPVGSIPPNPTELLEDPRMQKVMEHLKGMYDYIIFDCPPIDIVADTQIIEQYVDRTVFVLRVGVLERSVLPQLEAFFRDKKYKNISMILNCSDHYVGSKYSHYGYGYYKKRDAYITK